MPETYKFRLHGLELIDFHLSPRPLSNFEGKIWSFDINNESKLKLEDNLIIQLVRVNIREADKEAILGSIHIGMGFIVEGLEGYVGKNTNNEITLPEDLEILLRSITISTTRGIMFSQFKGTFLQNAILPIVFPMVTPQQEEDK